MRRIILPTGSLPGAGYRLPYHLRASGQEGRLFEKDSPHWRGNTDLQVAALGREEPITF